MYPQKHVTVLAAAILFGVAAAPAQSLLNPNGTAYTPFYTSAAGHSIAALETDGAGNVYYLDVDNVANDADGNRFTRLYQLTPTGQRNELFNFGASADGSTTFGSFVRLRGNELYWGESTNGGIWRGTLSNGGASLTGATQLGQVAGNYDFGFNPAGQAYVVGGDRLYRLTLNASSLTIGETELITSEFSGPFTFDALGRLIYGSSAFGLNFQPTSGGLYRYTPAELAAATPLSLDLAHLLLANGANQGLTFGSDGWLYRISAEGLQSYNYSGDFTRVTLAVTGSSDYFGGLSYSGGNAYAVVSSGFGNSSVSAVYKVVPEPGSATLCLAGFALAGARRWRRRG